MVTVEQLAARRREIDASADLRRLRDRLVERAAPLLERLPPVPEHKALLSVDGGVCPDDRVPLTFDPWSATSHRCPACGKSFTGIRHDRAWARYQHLWLAERAAHLATVAALADHRGAAARAQEILCAYGARYFRYPNRDNVLGPSRLFFSTYLESIWVLDMLAAAVVLRAADRLEEPARRAMGQIADEAANLIGDFDEGFSNRQTWNNAALTAIAVWFEDEELARQALTSPTGLLEHVRGFREDGLWYEGENYHLFALRGWLTGAAWATLASVDYFADKRVAPRILKALLAPATSALPDFTFPARKDSRFGVSLAQPMYLESWEAGRARLAAGGALKSLGGLDDWIAALCAQPRPSPETFESYLHDAGVSSTPHLAHRTELSWWALLEMTPEPEGDAARWRPASTLLENQGLAILRGADRYVSLECASGGGGHGHPDRLHLTLFADGVHWLPDFGTGSYVARDLFWYRSTLAHNAPRLDGVSQSGGPAQCEMFDTQDGWAWALGRWGAVRRAVVSGPVYVIDVVELAGREDRTLELPYHFAGQGEVTTLGRWEPATLADEFVLQVERFVPDRSGPLRIEHTTDDRQLTTHFSFEGELLRATAPGRPGTAPAPFFVVRTSGRNQRLVAVIEPAAGKPVVRAVRVAGDVIEVETAAGVERHQRTPAGWQVETANGTVLLAGGRAAEEPFTGFLDLDRAEPARAHALRVAGPPALDGTLAGFDTSDPFRLSGEDQYRRSEDPYPGPEELSARGYANWDESAVYLALDVRKAGEPCFRAADAQPLHLDNEPDDIHSDGVQVYLRAILVDGAAPAGYLVVPEPGGRLRVRRAGEASGGGDPAAVRGAWRRTERGYRVTLALPLAGVEGARAFAGGRLGFDVLVNEMVPGRERRAGQLVWSGGDGWVWLRGDRQDPADFGVLDLVG